MKKIETFNEGLILLKEKEILVYKPYRFKPSFLIYHQDNKISVYNENVHYYIGLDELKELFNEFKIYLFEKENDIEIDEEFRKLRQ